MSDKKYREFWVIDSWEGRTTAERVTLDEDPGPLPMTCEIFHVIEISALNAARIQQMEVSAAYYKPKIAELTAAIRDMVVALEKLRYQQTHIENVVVVNSAADEVLTKHADLIRELE